MNRQRIHIDPACAVYLFVALPLSAVCAVFVVVQLAKLAKLAGWLA